MSQYNRESISQYLLEINDRVKLTSEDEKELSIRIQNGDTVALNTLIKNNLKFVVNIAKEYVNQGIPLADLISSGNEGLMRAAMRFDPSKDVRFITYAVWWIRCYIMEELNENSRLVRLPTNVIQNLSRIKKKIKEMELVNGEGVINEELEEDILYLNKNEIKGEVSLNNKSCDNSEFSSLLIDKEDIRLNYNDNGVIKDELNKLIEKLKGKERDILKLSFGLDNNEEVLTLDEIGEKLGLTKVRVSQIRSESLRKLRHIGGELFNMWLKMENE